MSGKVGHAKNCVAGDCLCHRAKDKAQVSLVLAKLREIHKYSLRDLEKKTGVSNAYLFQVERGLRVPGLNTLRSIAFGYGMKTWELVRMFEE